MAFNCFFILHGAFTLSDLENACCKCYGFGSKKTFQKSSSLPNMEFKQVHERHFRRTAYMNTYLMCLGWAAGSVGTLASISRAIPDVFSPRSALQTELMLSNKSGKCRTRHSRATLSVLIPMLSLVFSLLLLLALCILI